MEQRKFSIKNPVMFGIIMKDPEFCIGLLERIFPGRKVRDLRFVYAADEEEEQLKQIEQLRKYFAQNKPVYSFQMYDANLCLPLGDEQYTMFLNSTCTENVPKELESFYHYLRTGKVTAGDIWLERMDAAVEAASLRKEVRRKVTLYDEMQMMSSLLKEAEEHLEQQKQEIAAKQLELDAKMAQLENSQAQLENSQAQLENSQAQLDAVKRLNARLAELGRIDDIIKAASDEAYCSQLMKELNVK